MASEPSEEDLRRLYLDWCSTQVARRFLDLSGDEVWVRSTCAASLPADSGESLPAISAIARIPDYLELVRKTALMLAEEMELPSFVEWRARYLEDPGQFISDILKP